ncbi:hypothetical protein JTB14_018130 [Gonioctena quinquepunctata]|nr:hypothetical protein JTB14_018130 [Gonioctena quinquepunctata]
MIDPVILQYFADPEDILLGMLGDTRHHIRELAVRRIFKARSSNIQQSLRQFEVPNSLNINASSYMDLIDWSTLVITEPPLTMGLPVEVLIEIVKNPDTSMLFSGIKSYPCHTQAVERAVKIVTEASATVCASENRDGSYNRISPNILQTTEEKKPPSPFPTIPDVSSNPEILENQKAPAIRSPSPFPTIADISANPELLAEEIPREFDRSTSPFPKIPDISADPEFSRALFEQPILEDSLQRQSDNENREDVNSLGGPAIMATDENEPAVEPKKSSPYHIPNIFKYLDKSKDAEVSRALRKSP